MTMKWMPNEAEFFIAGMILVILSAIIVPQMGGPGLGPEGIREVLPASVRDRVEITWNRAEWKGEADRQALCDLLGAYVKARDQLVWSEYQDGKLLGGVLLLGGGIILLLLALWRHESYRFRTSDRTPQPGGSAG